MQITMSRSQLMELNNALSFLMQEVSDGKPVKRNPYFSYAISRNRDLLKPIITAIDSTQKETLSEYLSEAEAINKSLEGKTDNEKKALIASSRPVLEEKYKDALVVNAAFLSGTESIDLYTINLSTVGDVSAVVMESLFSLCDPDK